MSSFLYDRKSPYPVLFYKWKCPECGDICQDPPTVHESMCHNGHEVKLCVAEGIYGDSMHVELVKK